ncbi:uncharacterized protein LOC124355135 [Homalodisca vitripennis]|nr:uncharacterized protein LOC124355135 [Homalodisca vitripennis]
MAMGNIQIKLVSLSSESTADSTSEEKYHKRSIHKRSLDSKQDPVNAIGEGANQTQSKNGLDTDNIDVTGTGVGSEESSSPTIQDVSENTTPTQSAEVVTKLQSELTTESDSPVVSETNDNDSETTTENKPVETDATDAEIEPTPTTPTDTDPVSELEVEPTTEKSEENNPSSENGDELAPTNSTANTEVSTETEDNEEKSPMDVVIERVNKLSDQIRTVLTNYRKEGVVVLPGQSFFPDPMSMQDFKKSFSVGTIDFKNMEVFGLSNFTVEHINTDVDRMQVYILLHMKRLEILGNYTLRTFFSRAAGPFNVTLLEVDSEGVAEVQTTADGHLEATDSVMDMFTKDMKVDFKNLGFMGSMFQGAVSAVGDALFDSIKPQILERVNLVIRTDVNKKLKELSVKFINKISPVDLAFSEGRKYVKQNGYDPYKIRDHSFILGGLVHVNITQFSVAGLSRFYRVGNLSLSMDAGVIEVGIHVMTHELKGHCEWSGETFGIVKSGKTNFTVDHLQVRALVTQSLDVRQKPQLRDLDLELGWVKVKMDSPMTLNLMIEGIINAFPRLIRHIIVDTLEEPLREKVQEILNKINVESVVDDNLPRLDGFGL